LLRGNDNDAMGQQRLHAVQRKGLLDYVGGTVRPSAFAVSGLMMSTILVG
jgi:hypothetical protein